MNRFSRQWQSLAYPDKRANGHDIDGYLVYCEFHKVSRNLLFQLLEYEKEKNANLRKRIHEQKQKIRSLERGNGKK